MALGESHIRIWMNMEFSKLIGSLSQLDCASQWISDLLQQWPRIQHFMVRTSWFHAFPVRRKTMPKLALGDALHDPLLIELVI